MKVVRLQDVPLVEQTDRPREGRLLNWRILTGPPDSLNNFMLALTKVESDFKTPRHRHNFDQIRYQMTGSFDYARDGKMRTGSVGYFPEGTYYGPAQSSDNSTFLLLQFGSASGEGYLGGNARRHAVQELKKSGEFHDGIYTRLLTDGRKKNQDGFEATWEHVTGRKLKYPPPRYEKPIFALAENFAWVEDEAEPGLWHKSLGIFGERGVQMGFHKLAAGGCIRTLPGASLYFVVKGRGRAGGEAWLEHSTLYVEDRAERFELAVDAETELFHIGLPNLSGLANRNVRLEAPAAQAAE